MAHLWNQANICLAELSEEIGKGFYLFCSISALNSLDI